MKIERVLPVITIFCLITFATMLGAEETIGRFTQPTLNGTIIKSETLKGMPMVINFASPW